MTDRTARVFNGSSVTGAIVLDTAEAYLQLKELFCETVNKFNSIFLFYAPWKHQEHLAFLAFLGDKKWEHWPEMD